MTVRTRVRVGLSRRVFVQLPDDVLPGEHDLTVTVDAPDKGRRSALGFPVDDVGPWPDGLDLSREALYGGDAG